MNVVQPGEGVVVEEQGGGVEDELRCGPGQLVKTMSSEIESVGVSARTDHTSSTLLSRHDANLEQAQCQSSLCISWFNDWRLGELVLFISDSLRIYYSWSTMHEHHVVAKSLQVH